MYDISIIGAGIIGAFIARELSRYDINVVVFEKNNDIGNETTMANSAIVHSGYDPIPGTEKAKFNVLGNSMYEEICKTLQVDFRKIGSLTIATSDEELETLKQLMVRSEKNKVPVQMLNKDEVLKMEPNLSDQVKGALLAPTAGIVYPLELCVALMENAMDNGVELNLNHEIIDILKVDKYYLLKTNKGNFKTKLVINCAGLYTEEIHNMISKPKFTINPRRGQYYVLDRSASNLVSHVIFPCPSDKGKGILVTPTTHGNILIGPTSEDINDKDGIETTLEAFEVIKDKANIMIKDIPYHKVIRSFSGLRATSSKHDFIIEEVENAKGFIDVAGIESPGLASAPAISVEVVRIINKILPLVLNKNFNPYRKPVIRFERLSTQDKQNLIKENPQYGTIICRCETITEGEIVDCINRNAGATTVKGVKKRVRPGMGRCQGGFCQPLVIDILARELGIDPLDVKYDTINSSVLVEETKI